MKDFSDGIVVFLNDRLDEDELLTKTKLGDFIAAARQEGVRSYFAGTCPVSLENLGVAVDHLDHVPLRRRTLINADEIRADHLMTRIKTARSWCWSKPGEEDLQAKAEKKVKELEEKFPNRSFNVLTQFEPDLTSVCCGHKGELGKIGIQEKVPRDEYLWITARAEATMHGRHLLQLLPFDKKLGRWLTLKGEVQRLLLEAIFCDLIAEQDLIREMDGPSRAEIKEGLQKLRLVEKWVEQNRNALEQTSLIQLCMGMRESIEGQCCACSCCQSLSACDGVARESLKILDRIEKGFDIDEDSDVISNDAGRLLEASAAYLPLHRSNRGLRNEIMVFEDYSRRYPAMGKRQFVQGAYRFQSEADRLRALANFAATC